MVWNGEKWENDSIRTSLGQRSHDMWDVSV